MGRLQVSDIGHGEKGKKKKKTRRRPCVFITIYKPAFWSPTGGVSKFAYVLC